MLGKLVTLILHGQIMKRALILSICALLAVCAISCNRQKEQGQEPLGHKDTDGITLDADVPDTEVYLAEKKLGTVPVTLSAKELALLCVTNPRNTTNVVFDADGQGETVLIGKGSGDFKYFMFLVPERVRSDYVPAETPWGIRTRNSGCTYEPRKSLRVICVKLISRDGLSLQLDVREQASSNSVPWKLRVTLSNHGQQVVKGFRPSIHVFRSVFSKGWNQQQPVDISLPKKWESVEAGQNLETEIPIDPPRDKLDHGVYVTFKLFKDETSNFLAGDGSCYSNTKLLKSP